MKTAHRLDRMVLAGLVLVLIVSLTGCTSMFGQGAGPAESADVPKTRQTTAVYYDFEDVLIPKELTIVEKQTVVVRSPGFVSGILTLKGRIERSSLFAFFNNNMQKDNWSVISQIKSPGTSILVFQKTSRTAVVTIRDEQINTWVEVGVAPTLSAPEPMMDALPDDDGLSESTLME